MGKPESDVDRFKQIRDQQLKARDPLKKERQLQHGISKRYRSSREPLSLGKIMTDVPNKWKGLFLGVLFGFLILFLLPYVVESEHTIIVGVLAVVFLALLGFAIGQSADARDELEELVKKR